MRPVAGDISAPLKACTIRIVTALAVCAVGSSLVACSSGEPAPRPDPPAESPTPTPAAQQSPWPTLPADDATADALIAEHRRRPASPDIEITVDRIVERILATMQDGSIVVGWSALRRWVADRARAPNTWILWGTFHDSRGQVDAFRRLFGPTGSGGLSLAVEQLKADGRWEGVDRDWQRGDTSAISSYLAEGDQRAWETLRRSQHEHNYTAWKYDYEDAILDILVAGRAGGQQVLPCDMAPALLERLTSSEEPSGETAEELSEDRILRLRELHCLLSLRTTLPSPTPPVAMLWGQAHVGSDGFRRFLAPDADVISIRVFGQRVSDVGIESGLAERLAITDPVLIPMEGHDELVLLLPDARLGTRMDRRLDPMEEPAPPGDRHRIIARSLQPGRLHAEGQIVELRDEPHTIRTSAGFWPFAFERSHQLVISVVEVPQEGWVDLDLGADDGVLGLLQHHVP